MLYKDEFTYNLTVCLLEILLEDSLINNPEFSTDYECISSVADHKSKKRHIDLK